MRCVAQIRSYNDYVALSGRAFAEYGHGWKSHGEFRDQHSGAQTPMGYSSILFHLAICYRFSRPLLVCSFSIMFFLTHPSRVYRFFFTAVFLILLIWLSDLFSLDQIRQCLPPRNCDFATSSAVTNTEDYGHEKLPNQTVLSSGILAVDVSSTQDAKTSIYSDATPPLAPGDDEECVALCLAVKDQVEDLPEYFTHHYYHLGVRRFYIMDDGTDPPLSTAKGPGEWGIPDSAITFHFCTLSFRSRCFPVCTVFRVVRHVARTICSLDVSHSSNLSKK